MICNGCEYSEKDGDIYLCFRDGRYISIGCGEDCNACGGCGYRSYRGLRELGDIVYCRRFREYVDHGLPRRCGRREVGFLDVVFRELVEVL